MGVTTRKGAAESKGPWYQEIRWSSVITLIFIPIYGFIQALWVPLTLRTLQWSLVYYVATMVAVTAGYHRLWSHRSYVAHTPLRLILAALGAGSMLGSAFFWARKHREHHRYTDTELDPYGINKGILYAHILWTMVKEPSKNIQVDVSDLKKDPIVAFQHKYYVPCTIFMSWVFPTLVAGYGWNDWFGGFIYAGILRTFFVNQGIFCLNSLAHSFGEQPYDDRRSPRNHWFTAIVTLGEGYHNFHHEFPSDYRNAIRWYQFDPTKWVIWLCSVLGMASNLKRFPQNEIGKGEIQMVRKRVDAQSRQYNWGPAIEDLPIMEWDDFTQTSKSPDGPSLIAIEGVIHDVSNFIEEHPGGQNFIKSAIGKDATALFNGGVYNHANAARNLLATLRVAILRGGGEVDIWKKTSTVTDETAIKTNGAHTTTNGLHD